MGNLVKGNNQVVSMTLLTVFGSVASIVGLILAIVFRIRDRNIQKMKDSNRHSQG